MKSILATCECNGHFFLEVRELDFFEVKIFEPHTEYQLLWQTIRQLFLVVLLSLYLNLLFLLLASFLGKGRGCILGIGCAAAGNLKEEFLSFLESSIQYYTGLIELLDGASEGQSKRKVKCTSS